MKVRWRSALMSFTMAPAIGCPAVSFTTPATTPRLSAAWAATAIAPSATPAARYLVKVFSVMRLPSEWTLQIAKAAHRDVGASSLRIITPGRFFVALIVEDQLKQF